MHLSFNSLTVNFLFLKTKHRPFFLDPVPIYAKLQFVMEITLVLSLALWSAAGAVHLGSDGVGDIGQLLLLFLKVLSGSLGTVLVKPLGGLLDGIQDLRKCIVSKLLYKRSWRQKQAGKAYRLLFLIINLATETLSVVDLVLEAESVVLKGVTGLNALTGSLVLLGKLLGFGNHAVDFLLGQAALIVGDGDGLLLASALVVGRNLEDTVGVKLEGDLNLGNAARSRGNASKLELAEVVVVLGKRTLALEDLDENHGLVVRSGGENLALASRNRRVTGDQLGHDSTSGLNTKGKRVDIHEDNLLGPLLSGENTSLNSSTKGDSLIRVDTLGGLLTTKVLLNESLNLGNTGRTTDKNNVINLSLLDVGILQDLLNRLDGLLEEVHVELLKLGTGQSLGEVVAIEESLNFDTGAHLRRQSTLGLLGLTLELTHGLEVLGDVNAVLLVVRLGKVVDDALIEILTTEMGVTSGSQNLENALVDGQKRDIKGTTTKIVDNDLSLLLSLVQTIGDSGGGGLVDNSEDVQTGNDTGILGSLALVVLWVG